MTESIRDRAFVCVGNIRAVKAAVENSSCMPCDTTTAKLLQAAFQLLEIADASAMEYALAITDEK